MIQVILLDAKREVVYDFSRVSGILKGTIKVIDWQSNELRNKEGPIL